MKRLLFGGSVLLLAATVAGRISGPAKATATCNSGGYHAGYTRMGTHSSGGNVPPDGGMIWADIQYSSGGLALRSANSHVDAYIGVDNSGGQSGYWVQAGIAYDNDPSHGLPPNPELYIEYKNASTGTKSVKVPEGPAAPGTPYEVQIVRNSSANWTATVGGHSLTVSASGANESQFMGEAAMAPGAPCNAMNFTFSYVNPWTTGQMTPHHDVPYSVSSVSAQGWNSVGG